MSNKKPYIDYEEYERKKKKKSKIIMFIALGLPLLVFIGVTVYVNITLGELGLGYTIFPFTRNISLNIIIPIVAIIGFNIFANWRRSGVKKRKYTVEEAVVNNDNTVIKSDEEIEENLRRTRQEAKDKRKLNIPIIIILFAIGILYPPLLIVAIWYLVRYFINAPDKKYTSIYKDEFVRKELQTHFNDVSYAPKGGFNSEIIKSKQLIVIGSVYKSEDYIKGKYNDTTFEYGEIHSWSPGDEDSSSTTYFNGRWLVLTLTKQINSELYLFQRNFPSYKKSDLRARNLDDVKMDNPEFNEHNTIFSTNPHDVYYMLTPHLMERLTTITQGMNKEKKSERLALRMEGNELHIAIHGANSLFEINEEFDANTMRDKVSNEVRIIKETIDLFRV